MKAIAEARLVSYSSRLRVRATISNGLVSRNEEVSKIRGTLLLFVELISRASRSAAAIRLDRARCEELPGQGRCLLQLKNKPPREIVESERDECRRGALDIHADFRVCEDKQHGVVPETPIRDQLPQSHTIRRHSQRQIRRQIQLRIYIASLTVL
jgi:hypothetical protein